MQVNNIKRPFSSMELEITPELESKIKNIAIEKLKITSENGFINLANWKVFKHIDYPHLVFKMCIGYPQDTALQRMEKRFDNMTLAKKVCSSLNLDLLLVPQAKLFIFDNGRKKGIVILEECIDINTTESGQRELYDQQQNDLNETARQLAIFVGETGFYDVAPRNVPLINATQGNRRVALIDLEFMNTKKKLFGFSGLIDCLFSETQPDTVIEYAKKQGLEFSKKERLKEIETYRKLQHHYQAKGLKTGKEPLQVDLTSLGLNLETIGIAKEYTTKGLELKKIPLRMAAEAMIQEINKAIQNKNDQNSIIGKRYICLNTNHQPLNNYLYSPYEDSVNQGVYWMDQIIETLVQKGHIHQIIQRNGHGFYLQV